MYFVSNNRLNLVNNINYINAARGYSRRIYILHFTMRLENSRYKRVSIVQ